MATTLQISGPMRILVMANLPPYVLGGAENQVAKLVEAWIGLGHQVEVAGHRIPNGLLRLGSIEVVTHRIAVTNRFGRAGRAITYLMSLYNLLKSFNGRFDIIYCRGLGDSAISICILKAMRFISLPMIACPINARGFGDAHFIRSIPGWRWLVGAINRHCNAINIIAPAIEEDLAKIGVIKPILYRIPNGILLDREVVRAEISSVRRLIWTGRLAHQKGMDVLFKALAKVISTGRNFKLDIFGDGPDASPLHMLCRELGLERCVSFHGVLARSEIRAHLVKADVFVLPSRYEGMSNAALEAMEASLPLLLTRCGGIDEFVDESVGWMCKPDDVERMFDCLCKLLDEPNAIVLEKGRMARKVVESLFSMQFVAQSNIDLLQAVVINSPTSKHL